ncbi:MAG TPA: A/G-specific adenine glycosylase [Myxococcales bacterium]|nr:A/G-specific adenine glycosylase [Myxococcales bacterium]
MISTKLLAWFAKERRDLPWREEPRDPYRVWISEVMLQQTRVDVVVPYYLRFVRRFPTLRALARAPLDDVLAHWSGLGYYARARNLHAAARAAGEALPRTCAELRRLPGFGPYTAAAVASLAFGEDVPLVDGNVARVLSRLRALEGDARAQAWDIAAELLPKGRGGAFNEALMELGATVCTPRSPRCAACPVRGACAVRTRGLDPERYPTPRARPERPLLEWRALALRRADGAVLLARRGQESLFAGLWDLPSERPSGIRIQGKLAACGVVEQTLTHRQVRVTVQSARGSGAPTSAEVRWVAAEGIAAMGISSLTRKSLRQAGILTPARPSRTLPAP